MKNFFQWKTYYSYDTHVYFIKIVSDLKKKKTTTTTAV
jgi:hypothetical protein